MVDPTKRNKWNAIIVLFVIIFIAGVLSIRHYRTISEDSSVIKTTEYDEYIIDGHAHYFFDSGTIFFGIFDDRKTEVLFDSSQTPDELWLNPEMAWKIKHWKNIIKYQKISESKNWIGQTKIDTSYYYEILGPPPKDSS